MFYKFVDFGKLRPVEVFPWAVGVVIAGAQNNYVEAARRQNVGVEAAVGWLETGR